MSEQNNIQDLLRKGTEAAREGNRSKAREYFEQVVELDENNEKGWFFLSKVVETDEERRICLANVLHINPNNEAAQKAMEKLAGKERKKLADQEVMPGITRRQLTLALGGGVILVVLIVGLLLVTSIGRSNQAKADEATGTAVVQVITDAAVTIAAQQTSIEGTHIADVGTDTPTPRPTIDFGPTWTPVPVDVGPATPETLPCPVGLDGNLLAWGGRDIMSNDYLPIVIYPLASCGQSTRVGGENDVGRYPRFDPSGQRVIYTAYFPTTFDYGILSVNVNGTDREDIAERWRSLPDCGNFLRPEMAQYSFDGSKVVFLAIPTEASPDFTNNTEPSTAVYLLNLSVPPDVCPVTRLTNDAATYRYPAISPDGTRVAVIRNDANSANPGTDLVVIDVASQAQLPITNDFATFTETSPRWTPDGLQILYAAADRNNPNNNDIILINGDGSGTPIPILEVRSDADEIFPIPSPDGNYIAFASNRSGFYDLYIFDRTNGTLSQLTNTEDDDFPGDWWRP